MAQFYAKRVLRREGENELCFDYKDVKLLQRCINGYGQIEGRKRNGLSNKQQRQLATAVKRARHLALLPFVIK